MFRSFSKYGDHFELSLKCNETFSGSENYNIEFYANMFCATNSAKDYITIEIISSNSRTPSHIFPRYYLQNINDSSWIPLTFTYNTTDSNENIKV